MFSTIQGVIPSPDWTNHLLAADINISLLVFTDVHFINSFSYLSKYLSPESLCLFASHPFNKD